MKPSLPLDLTKDTTTYSQNQPPHFMKKVNLVWVVFVDSWTLVEGGKGSKT